MKVFNEFVFSDVSAAGLDGWTIQDLKLMSPLAAQLLADCMNTIEEGAPWPEVATNAKSAFLAKDPKNLDDCLSYRLLTILPFIYRKWAAIRHKDLKPWIDLWALPEMHAGAS